MQMIYQFRSKAGPDVIMLADLTERIFTILGLPLEPRGVLTTEQLPDLIQCLEAAILKDLTERAHISETNPTSGEVSKTTDRLGQRAYPFLELLKQSKAKDQPVIWGI
jgi:hypothetical protein